MLQKLKCLMGSHQEIWLDMELPYYQQVLMKCGCCGKYGLWQTGINCTYWVKDINKFPKIVADHIRKNEL